MLTYAEEEAKAMEKEAREREREALRSVDVC
jgi:hypothetical protein